LTRHRSPQEAIEDQQFHDKLAYQLVTHVTRNDAIVGSRVKRRRIDRSPA
jgi:hypothetical protein